tara:strand:- start:89 stop:250 length:162 start_codon:yes stop_codon:yes gene_type:complete
MTKKEKQQIDGVIGMAIIANIRDAKPRELLVAFANDIRRIRDGEEPMETKELV